MAGGEQGLSGIVTPSCRHEWQRAPERDQLYGAMPTREALLVFWCSKCLAIEQRRFLYDRPEVSA